MNDAIAMLLHIADLNNTELKHYEAVIHTLSRDEVDNLVKKLGKLYEHAKIVRKIRSNLEG